MVRGASFLVLCLASCFLVSTTAYPLCVKNLEAPGPSGAKLAFCSAPEYATNGCCNAQDDANIKKSFDAMKVADPTCAAFLKEILCSRCDAYSADLHGATLVTPSKPFPYLCTTNSTSTDSYCSRLWRACSAVAITNSPFESNSTSKSTAPLTSFYDSEATFCAPQPAPLCFSGTPLTLPEPVPNTPPAAICLERLDSAQKKYYLNLVPHPDGSERVFVNTQDGLIYMASVADGKFGIDYNAPFLNISDRTLSDNELGFMGFAFHPEFMSNGRFFISYNCDKDKHPDCKAECGCGSANFCNSSAIYCQYSAIVAEYTVNATDVTPETAVRANPEEVRRIFAFGLPYENHHAGGLWFGPEDKYLYYPLGDGGLRDDPWNNAQNLNIVLGKMLRLDINTFPGNTTGLYGNYTIPKDNPFVGVNKTRGEIWAYGLRNPWRCSFDRQRPSYFYCADVGQDTIEEVDLISRGGNYGWRVYEGTKSLKPKDPPPNGRFTDPKSINAIKPIVEYNHTRGISIAGGYVSYSRQDACAYGHYLYGDLNGEMFSAFENPPSSGKYAVSDLGYKCSSKTPVPCDNNTELAGIISYGEDNEGNIYVLAINGAYRMVNPSLCGISCTEALPPVPAPLPAPPVGAPSHASALFVLVRNSAFCLVLALCALVWL